MSHKVIIDRIEGTWAHLEGPGGVNFDIPTTLLPPGAADGDVLDWNLVLDEVGAAERRQALAAKLAELTEDDDGGDFSL